MRVTTAFHRLLGLQDITVRGVSFPAADAEADTVVVEVGLRRKRLACPLCSFTTRARYDTRPVFSTWCCPPFVLHMTAPLPMTMERRSTSCAIVTLAA